MEGYSVQYYQRLRDGASESARVIVPLVLDLVRPDSVVDVGCGTGAWLAVFAERGVADYLGIDGPHVDQNQLEIPGDYFIRHDLRCPFEAHRQFDLAVNLEVAEHLPAESASTLIDTLTQLSSIVLFSAAIPAQGGEQHINEQWPDHWVGLFADRGYQPIDCLRAQVWNDDQVEWWYAQNILLFAKGGSLKRLQQTVSTQRDNAPILNLVHPRNFAHQLWKQRILESALDIAEAIPEGSFFLLADDGQLDPFPVVGGRVPVAFPLVAGEYTGPPCDDHEACNLLEAAQQSEIRHLVIAWPSYWWFDAFPTFYRQLKAIARSTRGNERIKVYQFRRQNK